MFRNQEILQLALEQSARDLGARPADFLQDSSVLLPWALGPEAKKFYKEPLSGNLVSYGSNIVAAVREDCRDIVERYLQKFPYYHCFETPNLHWLEARLEQQGQKVCFMAEYFLPDVDKLKPLPCPYELRVLTQADFAPLYVPAWSNALCESRKELDVLGVGAYDKGKLIALAACSADCETLWQIGVDVLPAYRRQGIAAALTSRLALEILARGKVPFYCCAWANIPSARNAIKSGFLPAWAELSLKPGDVVDEMNQ